MATWIHPAAQRRSSDIEGDGMFARKHLGGGTVMARLRGRIVDDATLHELFADAAAVGGYVDTIMIDDDQNLVLAPAQLIHFCNHSCDPSLWHLDTPDDRHPPCGRCGRGAHDRLRHADHACRLRAGLPLRHRPLSGHRHRCGLDGPGLAASLRRPHRCRRAPRDPTLGLGLRTERAAVDRVVARSRTIVGSGRCRPRLRCGGTGEEGPWSTDSSTGRSRRTGSRSTRWRWAKVRWWCSATGSRSPGTRGGISSRRSPLPGTGRWPSTCVATGRPASRPTSGPTP